MNSNLEEHTHAKGTLNESKGARNPQVDVLVEHEVKCGLYDVRTKKGLKKIFLSRRSCSSRAPVECISLLYLIRVPGFLLPVNSAPRMMSNGDHAGDKY